MTADVYDLNVPGTEQLVDGMYLLVVPLTGIPI